MRPGCTGRHPSSSCVFALEAGQSIAANRADAARAGAAGNVKALVDELCRLSPEFEAIWRENEVRSTYGEVAKTLRHPLAGLITLEYSAFAVDGRPDLDMVIYSPATPADKERIRSLIGSRSDTAR